MDQPIAKLLYSYQLVSIASHYLQNIRTFHKLFYRNSEENYLLMDLLSVPLCYCTSPSDEVLTEVTKVLVAVAHCTATAWITTIGRSSQAQETTGTQEASAGVAGLQQQVTRQETGSGGGGGREQQNITYRSYSSSSDTSSTTGTEIYHLLRILLCHHLSQIKL